MATRKVSLSPKARRSKELIYRTALDMLVEKGFKATTVRDICKRANVSIGAFYAYFESKQSILFEVIREIDHYFTEEVAEQLKGIPCPESVVSYFKFYSAYLEEQISLDTLCVIFSVDDIWLTRSRPTQLVLVSVLMDGQLKGVLRTDMEAQAMCDYLFSLIHGVVFTWCSTKCAFRLSNQIEDYVRLALSGLVADSKDAPSLRVDSDMTQKIKRMKESAE